MNTQQFHYFSAATYNCDAYGEGSYNENNCSTSTVGSPDTGIGAAVGTPYFIGGAVLIVLAVVLAASLVIRKRRSGQQ